MYLSAEHQYIEIRELLSQSQRFAISQSLNLVIDMRTPNLLILLAVLLPPKSLDVFGPVVEERTIDTAYGTVGPLALRALGDSVVWVQPYMGLPTRTDPRATIAAAKHLGVKKILAWDMGVAINPVLRRGQPLIATDSIEWMSQQPNSFFGDIELELDPEWLSEYPAFCPQMTSALNTLMPFAPSVVYLGVDGPRRETPAEARMFRAWGVDVSGQNLVPEVSLARELGLCFAGLVTVTAYAADQALQIVEGELRVSLERTIQILPSFVSMMSELTSCTCNE